MKKVANYTNITAQSFIYDISSIQIQHFAKTLHATLILYEIL